MAQYRIVQKKNIFYIQKKGWWFWHDQWWYDSFFREVMNKAYDERSAKRALDDIIESKKLLRSAEKRKAALPDFKVIKEVEDVD